MDTQPTETTRATGARLFDLTLTGQLSLDLVNTVDWRGSENPKEMLNSYDDLVRWARHTGVLTEREARHLLRQARRRPGEAKATLEEAKDVRELFFRIFSARAAGRRPEKSDLKWFNELLSKSLSHLRIAPVQSGFAWEWEDEENGLNQMLWAAVRAAGELLVDSTALDRLRECPGEGCRWLFIDTSRNKSRRWCTMEICGNRAKARRHYRQLRTGRRDSPQKTEK
jgi:predicted RNA-binding Zn ribbon-like protein